MSYLPCAFADLLDELDERDRQADARQRQVEERTAELLEEYAADLTWDAVLECLNDLNNADDVRLRAILGEPLGTMIRRVSVGNTTVALAVPDNLTTFRIGAAIVEAVVNTLKNRAEESAENSL